MDLGQAVLRKSPLARQARKLRIAVVTETYPPEINGVAMTIGRVVAGLRQREHAVQLVRPRQHSKDDAANERGFQEVLTRGFTIPFYKEVRVGFPAKRMLIRMWKENRPDIVHIVTEGPLGGSALAAARELNIAASSDFHTNFHTYSTHYGFGWLKKPIMDHLRKLHNAALCTLVPTERLRGQLAAEGYKNLKVVPRGVDSALFNPAKRSLKLRQEWGVGVQQPVVIYVGRLAPEKNLPLVLSVFEQMRALEPSAKLVLVGGGPTLADLRERYPHHIFTGMRTGEELAAHYASGDIFLFPSTTETYGNVTVEAMASGLAVVAYDYAAAAEHIRHGRQGLLADFDNSEEFARLAVELVSDPVRMAKLGGFARQAAEALDWSRVFESFEATLLQLLREREANDVKADLSLATD